MFDEKIEKKLIISNDTTHRLTYITNTKERKAIPIQTQMHLSVTKKSLN